MPLPDIYFDPNASPEQVNQQRQIAPADETAQQRFMRRLRNYKLNGQEKELIERSKKLASGYGTVSSLAAGTAAFLWARNRKMSPLASLFFYTGVIVLGSQVGSLLGMYRGARELQSLPHSELRRIMSDFKTDIMREKLGIRGETSTAVALGDETFMSDGAADSMREVEGTGDDALTQISGSASSVQKAANSAWDQIRNKGRETGTAWDRLRGNSNSNSNSSKTGADDQGERSAYDSGSDSFDREDVLMNDEDKYSSSSSTASKPASSDNQRESAWDRIRRHDEAAQLGQRVSTGIPADTSRR
ncbi:hypothetical protein RI367_000844 [Sorochytrium milnesiophthora]